MKNHAFSSEKLRQQFPLKSGDLFKRGKVASGLQSLRKLYGTQGFLDFTAIPETNFGSNATVNLNISIQEGPQYHMGKLNIVADKEVAAKLHAEWKLAEGDVYDHTYIDQFFETNRDSLPLGFSRANVHTIQNCPDAVVEVRLIVPSPTYDFAQFRLDGGEVNLLSHPRRIHRRINQPKLDSRKQKANGSMLVRNYPHTKQSMDAPSDVLIRAHAEARAGFCLHCTRGLGTAAWATIFHSPPIFSITMR